LSDHSSYRPSPEDIHRYYNDEMSKKEEHELEKAALSDPFLMEALEGFERVDPKSIGPDLSQLKKQLKKANGHSAWIYRAAATILVVSSMALVFYLLNDTSQDASLADKIEKPQETEDQTPIQKVEDEETNLAEKAEVKMDAKPAPSQEKSDLYEVPTLESSENEEIEGSQDNILTEPIITEEETLADLDVMTNEDEEPETSAVSRFADEDYEAVALDEISLQEAEKELEMSDESFFQARSAAAPRAKRSLRSSAIILVSGSVYDLNDNAIDSVQISFEKEDIFQETTNKSDGSFEIELAPNDFPKEIFFNRSGYSDTSILVSENSYLKIILRQED